MSTGARVRKGICVFKTLCLSGLTSERLAHEKPTQRKKSHELGLFSVCVIVSKNLLAELLNDLLQFLDR